LRRCRALDLLAITGVARLALAVAVALLTWVGDPFDGISLARAENPAIEIVPTVGHTYRISAIAFSPDGRTVLSGGEDKTLKLWDVGTGRLLRTLVGHSGSIRTV